jgi:hypothetical protein
MALLGHRLPVISIPEQCHITAMRNYVVNHRCLAQSQLALLAFLALTQRMLPQESLTGLLPLVPITASGGTLTYCVRLFAALPGMHLTIGARRNELTTALLLAWTTREGGHRQQKTRRATLGGFLWTD